MKKLAKNDSKRKPYYGLYVRLYASSLDDIKIRQMDAETRCFWMDALLLAKGNHGVLPSLREIAFRLRMSEAEARSRIMALVSLELIDEDHLDGGVVWTIHAWDRWQQDGTSTPRVKRHRERLKYNETQVKRKRNVSCNANETLETVYSSSSSLTNSRSRVRYGSTNSIQKEGSDSSEGTYTQASGHDVRKGVLS
jgi:hypothetical protein